MTHPDTLQISRAVVEQALEAMEPFAGNASGIHKDWADERRRASLTQDKPLTVAHFRVLLKASEALRAALQPQAAEAQEPATRSVRILQKDANSYCRIVSILGMEEEGDPVEEVRRLKARDEEQAAAEPVLWQYRWTNPAGDNQPASMLEWKDVVPAWNQTMQDRITELIAYRYNGNPTYEVRGLYTTPPATQAALTAALEALKAQPRVTREVWKDGIDIDVAVPHTKLRDAAIVQLEALGE